jgi:hypothetical protein
VNDLSEQILNATRARHVKQIPAYRFVLARFFTGFLFVLTMLVGSLAFGLVLEALWPEARQGMRGQGFHQMTLGALPLILGLFTGLVVILGAVVFRHFRYGYRVRGIVVVPIVLALSLVLGVANYKLDLTFKVHRTMMHNVMPYRMAFEGQRRELWVNPKSGRLAGVVISKNSTGLVLQDFSGHTWIVRGQVPLNNPKQVRVLGQICGNDFCAESIEPWNMMGGMGPMGPGMGRGMGHKMGNHNW